MALDGEDADHGREALLSEIARLRAQVTELTEQAARVDRELSAARALHAATIESLPFDFWARDREGYCFSQNSTTYANWGDLLNKRPQDMDLPKDVLELWTTNMERVLAGEIVRHDVEYTLHGKTRHIDNIIAPIRMGEAVVGALGVNLDVTERRYTLQALRESEAKLRMVAEGVGVGLWTWDPVRDDVVWEPALSAIFGLAPGTAPAGRDAYLALIHADDRERAAMRIAEGFVSGRWEDEYRIVRADGAVRWVLSKGTVIREQQELRIVGAVIDVTERRERDEQLRQAQKLEAVGQLTAGIAHNFNNMLMGILPNVELAMRRAPKELAPQLEVAAESARRAAELVRQLMTYAGRNRAMERTVEDLAPLVDRAVALCRTTFDRRIAIHQMAEAGAYACVDPTQIEQAVLNVLINARDAFDDSPLETPRVDVSVSIVPAGTDELGGHDGDHVRVRIRDNGVGMDAKTSARIYEPFFTTKDVGKGTGLGLATTHAILREHRGFITCESACGQGTTFSLYLPRESRLPQKRSVASERAPAGRTETLLVVDDEPAVRLVVSLILRSAGYVVREAASGREALSLLEGDPELARTLALVVLDVSMPGLPRREIRARLREITRARVLYFTGYAFDAADADPDDSVLEKPVAEQRLLSAIRHAIDGGK